MQKKFHRVKRENERGRSFSGFKSLITSVTSLIFILLITFPAFAVVEKKPEVLDDEQHNVGVSAHLIPFYAEDADGNPVYDLEQEELELLVNKKPFPVMALTRHRFDLTEEKMVAAAKETPSPKREQARRFNIIMVDYMFNNVAGLLRTTYICRRIIQQSSPDDAFVIMENVPEHGVAYLAGPTADRALLMEALKKVNERGMEIMKTQYKKLKNYGENMMYGGGVSLHASKGENVIISLHKTEEENNNILKAFSYKMQAYSFRDSVARLQNALDAISRPKLVFLVSMGVRPSVIGHERMEHYLKTLKQSARAINRNGGILYVIDSSYKDAAERPLHTGEWSLQALASGGNGKYFSGNDLDKLALEVHKSTSAYYELAINPNTLQRFNIEIRCRRPGIKIFSVGQSERSLPYARMKTLQRKLFALNVVTGGSWSRSLGNVKLLPFTRNQTAKEHEVGFAIDLPDKIKNRPLDVYIININPQTHQADFVQKQWQGKTHLELSGMKMPERRLYFVVIEPQTATCLFNRVI